MNEIEVKIRPAEKSDLEPLRQLALETYVAAFGASFAPADLDAYLAETLSPAHIAAYIAEDVVLVAEDADTGRLVGYVHFGQNRLVEGDPPEHSQQIRRLYVHPDYQNQGLGRLLMEAALNHPVLKEAAAIYLDVWEKNTGAQRFYGRYGFEIVDQRLFIHASGEPGDYDFIMVRRWT